MGEGRGRRGKLEFDPPSMARPSPEKRETVRPRPAGPRSEQGGEPGSDTRHYAPAAAGTNKPMILSILYLTSVLVGLTGLVAFILALVWKSEPGEEWEQSHYQYHMMTFLLWLGTTILAFILIVTIIGALIGIPMLFLAVIWVLVRSVMSLVRAANREPIPNPGTWLA